MGEHFKPALAEHTRLNVKLPSHMFTFGSPFIPRPPRALECTRGDPSSFVAHQMLQAQPGRVGTKHVLGARQPMATSGVYVPVLQMCGILVLELLGYQFAG